MKNLIKNLSIILLVTTMSSFTFSQESTTLDRDIQDMVVHATELSEEIEILTKMKKSEDPKLEKRQAAFDESFLMLEEKLESLKRSLNGLDDDESENGTMKRTQPLIRHMMLFSDEVIKFRAGDEGAGKKARKTMQDLKSLPQEIRKEVQDAKNDD